MVINEFFVVVAVDALLAVASGISAALFLPDRFVRPAFLVATIALPLLCVGWASVDSGSGTAAFVFALSVFGAVFLTVALLASNLQPTTLVGRVAETRQFIVLYAVSNVLWFGLLFWTGSRSEFGVFAFELAARYVPVGTEAGNVACTLGQVQARCVDRATPLDLFAAMQLSGGNLLTLGAAGTIPLSVWSRLAMMFQLVPLFVSAIFLTREQT